MARKAWQLEDMDLDEISLVDRGANPGAKVVLMKRDVSKMIKEEDGKFCVYSMDGKKLGEHDTMAAAQAQLRAVEANKETKKGSVALVEWIDGLVEKAGEGSSRGYKQKIESVGQLIRAGFDPAASLSVVGLPAIPHLGLPPITIKSPDDFTDASMDGAVGEYARVMTEKAGKKISASRLEKLKALYKTLADIISEQEPDDDDMEGTKMNKIDVSKLDAATQAHIAELEKRATEADAAIAKAAEDAKAAADKASQEAIAKAQKDAEDAKAEVAKERDARLNKEYEGKVSVFKRLSVATTDAKVFRAIDEKLPEDVAKRVWEIMAGADEVLKSAGIMEKQIGSSNGDDSSGDPVSKVQELTKAMIAKNDKMKDADAMALVFQQNPGLHAAYRNAVAVRV